MANWQVLIDGVDKTSIVRPVGKFKLGRRLGSETLEFTLIDPTGAYEVPEGAVIRVLHLGSEVFEGLERITVKTDLQMSGIRVMEVSAVDYNVLVDMDVIKAAASRSVDESDKDRITWLVTTYGTKGITAGAGVQELVASLPQGSDGIPRQDLGWQTLGKAIQAVAKYAGGGGRFYVDRDKDLKYGLFDGVIAAPFNFSTKPNNSTTFKIRNFELTEDKIDKVHRVVVRGLGGIEVTRELASLPPAAKIVEDTFFDPDITSVAQANAAGDQYLAEHGVTQFQGSLETRKPGLDPGMTIQITHGVYGLNAAPFLISSIDVKIKGADIAYKVNFGTSKPDLATLSQGTSTQITQAAEGAAGEVVEEAIADLSVAGANLVPNSSFENNALGSWAAGANWVFSFLPESPDLPFDRNRTARLEATAAAVGELVSPPIQVVRTDDYWASFWRFIRATNGNVIAELREYSDTAGTTLVQTTTLLSKGTTDSAWARTLARFGPNDQLGRVEFHASTVSVRFAWRMTGTPTVELDVDGVQLERGPIHTAYAPTPYELMDESVFGDTIADGGITGVKITDDAITAAKIQAGAVTTEKLAANAVVAGKIAAGTITSGHIATSGLDADVIKTGTLEIGGVAGAIDFIKVYNSSGQLIAYLDETGYYSIDPGDPNIYIKLNESGLFLTRDDGVNWLTAFDQFGLHADAVEIGIEPGGSNLIPNAGLEIAAFTSPLSKIWTVTADWDDGLSQVLVDVSGSSLNLTSAAY